MKPRLIVIATLALGGSLTALALSGPSAAVRVPASAPMHTVLLPPVPAPPVVPTTTTTVPPTTTTTQPPAPVIAAPVAPAPPAAVTTTTTTVPQDQAPPDPSNCLLWIPANTEMNPNPTPELIYGGGCAQAQAFAANNPPDYVTPQN